MKNFGTGLKEYHKFFLNLNKVCNSINIDFKSTKQEDRVDRSINITINNHFGSNMKNPVTFIK